MKRFLVYTLAVTLIGLLGCQEKGSAEKAGERVDEIIDNVKDGENPLKQKGTMEKVGESIDDTIKSGDKK